jgi:hypothetical protein
MSSLVRQIFAAGAAALIAGSGAAQLLPPVGVPPVNVPVDNVPVVGPGAGPVVEQLLNQPAARQAISPTLDSVAGLPEGLAEAGAPTLLELRRLRLQELVRTHRNQLEIDGDGQPVARGRLLAVDPRPADLQLAARAGFTILTDERHGLLGLRVVQLRVPRGLSARQALKRLRAAAPGVDADYDHVFEPAGGQLLPVAGALAASQSAAGRRTIGMIDGGVASHPSLAAAPIEQNGFAGAPQATGHGTAVASLIAGDQGSFRGAARGSSLLVADVYGGNRAAGSATAVVRALAWLAGRRSEVINISLVGPPNRLMAQAIGASRARGIQLVAAVGNDGPAAPPQYPASYPGVIAVTGVDAHGRALREAGKAAHLDFAAPGADMAAALPGQGYAIVRGTSFAAPLAAARLAMVGSAQRLAAEARPGRGRVGRGIVCANCRVPPKVVRAKKFRDRVG